MKWLSLVFAVTVSFMPGTLGANVLAICTVASHSHSLWYYQFMEVLIKRGHHVTVFGVDKPRRPIENMTTFIVEGLYEATYNTENVKNFVNSKSIVSIVMDGFVMQDRHSTPLLLKSAAMKNLLEKYENVSKPFDIVIYDLIINHALLGLVHHFGNPPLLLATAYEVPEWWMLLSGNIPHPAYLPHILLPYDHHMTLYEKCVNIFYYIVSYYANMYMLPPNNEIMKEVFGTDTPSTDDIMRQANVMLVNYHFAINGARPLLPGVIPVAGLHLTTPQPLHQELQEYMDSAKDGVILLSFGSNIDLSWLPENLEETLLTAVQGLPQKVLMKWGKSPANQPQNVRIEKWLPQNSILAHPNIQLFVTHCGILSLQEATFYGVPLLGLPVFLDQHANAERLKRAGVVLTHDINTVTSVQLRNTIQELLNNPQYKKKMMKMSELMRDTPATAREQAVYWTEYVLNHNGAAHLRSAAADMPLYQVLMLDVLGVILSAVLLFILQLKFTVTFLCRLLLSSSVKVKTN